MLVSAAIASSVPEVSSGPTMQGARATRGTAWRSRAAASLMLPGSVRDAAATGVVSREASRTATTSAAWTASSPPTAPTMTPSASVTMLIRPTRDTRASAGVGQPRVQCLGEHGMRAQVVGDEEGRLGHRDRVRDDLVRLGVRERQQRHHHAGRAPVRADQVAEHLFEVILAATQVADPYLGAVAGGGRHVGDPHGDLLALRPG